MRMVAGMKHVNLDAIQAIAKMRMEGLTAIQIADKLDMTPAQVRSYAHRHDLPRKMRQKKAGVQNRVGKIGILVALEHDEILRLDELTSKWGCASLADAAIEILKDELAKK